MYPSHQQQPARSTETQSKKDICDSPWSDLRLTIPNTRSGESIISFVECTLAELTHEDVGAEYISSNGWGVKRTQFIAVDDVGETFRKRHYDERLGWHEQTIGRQAVREELVNRLSRPPSLATGRSHDAPVDEPDTFAVKARHRLQHETRKL